LRADRTEEQPLRAANYGSVIPNIAIVHDRNIARWAAIYLGVSLTVDVTEIEVGPGVNKVCPGS
jgi:hypothetical protein